MAHSWFNPWLQARPVCALLFVDAHQPGLPEPNRSMKGLASLLAATVFLSACSSGSQTSADGKPVVVTSTNTFYEMGWLEGRKHAKERPETSLMVFPEGSTNWTPASKQSYRKGYIDGLAAK